MTPAADGSSPEAALGGRWWVKGAGKTSSTSSPSPLVCWLWDAAAPRRAAAGPAAPRTEGASQELAAGRISCFWILPGAWDVLPARDESLNDSCLLAGDTKTNEV